MNYKTLSVILIFTVISAFSFSQDYKKPDMPLDANGKDVVYTKVVEAPGNADKLYKKAIEWFKNYYRNPTNVLKTKDTENKKIVGSARFKILNPPDKKGITTMKGIIIYTIELYFKDGRFKYFVKKIHLKKASYFGIEKWLNSESQTFRPVQNHYLTQIHEKINETLQSLTNFMKKEEKKVNDDW